MLGTLNSDVKVIFTNIKEKKGSQKTFADHIYGCHGMCSAHNTVHYTDLYPS